MSRDPDCCEEEMNDRPQQSRYGESRPFRLGHPWDVLVPVLQ